MNELNDTLPVLMHRATKDLEPVTNDLLERTVQQGVRLRRRRTTVLSVSGATAAVATVGLVAGGLQVLGSQRDGAVVEPAAPAVTSSAVATTAPVTQKEVLATLKRLISGPGRTLSHPVAHGTENDFIAASYLVDDGHGKSFIEVLVAGGGVDVPCNPPVAGCRVNADGSQQYAVTEAPQYSDSRQAAQGVVNNWFELRYSDGRYIGLMNYNSAREKGTVHTRPKPVFTTAQLAAIARSKAWRFPNYTEPIHSSAKKPAMKPAK